MSNLTEVIKIQTNEIADLKVVIQEIDAALCNYCNTVDETWYDHVPSSWDEASKARFRDLCAAYNRWHERSAAPGAVSMAFYEQHGKELHDAKTEIERQHARIEQLEAALQTAADVAMHAIQNGDETEALHAINNHCRAALAISSLTKTETRP